MSITYDVKFRGKISNLDTTTYSEVDFNNMYHDGTYLYVAMGSLGIAAYSFNGTTLSFIVKIDDGGSYTDVWGDGTYIYVACGNSGIRAYTFNGTSFTLKDTDDQGGTYVSVWGDGTYIYTACGSSGIRAYTFNGTSFTLKDTDDQGGTYMSVWGDGTYIYVTAFDSGTYAYTFNGSSFTHKDTIYDSGISSHIHGDGTYIYVGTDAGLAAYTFDGNNFSRVGFFTNNAIIDTSTGVHVENKYIYFTGYLSDRVDFEWPYYYGTSLILLTFNGNKFKLISSLNPDSLVHASVYVRDPYIYSLSGVIYMTYLHLNALKLEDDFSFDETGEYLTNLSITNATTNNAQTASMQIVSHPSASSVDVGDRVDIDINEESVFQGNVSRKEFEMKGSRLDTFELIGVTSKLWQNTIRYGEGEGPE